MATGPQINTRAAATEKGTPPFLHLELAPPKSSAMLYPGSVSFPVQSLFKKKVMINNLTKEEYIKMCDCPEIQGQWLQIFKVTDYCFNRKTKETGIYHFVKEQWKDGSLNGFVWLPRQDQIQEMITEGWDEEKTIKDGWDNNYHRLLYKFYYWISEETHGHSEDWGLKQSIQKDCPSFEQLWLAFYMEEKHEKTWDGKEWIK